MEYRIIKPDEYRTMPWKNGKGMTTELFVRNCTDSEKYIYRLSTAGVTENGQFSDFSGYDRILIMLKGNGINLKHSDGKYSSILTTSDIAEFSGDVQTSAELVNGPIKDFNVMTLRERCSSRVKVISRTESFKNEFEELFVYGVSESEISAGSVIVMLNKGELLFMKGTAEESIKVNGNAITVAIRNIVA